MGCGAQGSKRLAEAEGVNQRSADSQFVRIDSQGDVAELENILKELEDAKRARIDAEGQVAKVLAQDATLREELQRFEANASAEASRSSRLDGRCSVLEVESRTFRDELASSSNARDQLEEVSKQLRRELAAKDQELLQLQSQLQRKTDEATDLQAQRDYALSELKAANQVAEALKSTSTVLDKRRKPVRRSRPNEELIEPPGSAAVLEITATGVVSGEPEMFGTARQSELQEADPPAELSLKSESSLSPVLVGASVPDVPWADTPEVNSSKAFGSFACETGEVVLAIDEGPADHPSEVATEAQDPKIFSDPSAKVFKFDFSVFDFLKHEALRTPPDSPLEIGDSGSGFPAREDAADGGLRLGALEAAPLQIPERNELQADAMWSDARWSTRV